MIAHCKCVQILWSLIVILGFVCAPAAIARTLIPTPEVWFGHKMGTDRKLESWADMVAYFRALAGLSDRIELVELGESTEGRPYIALFISASENLAQLERYRQMNATLSDPRGATQAELDRIVVDGKVVVVQTYGLHSNEVATPLAAVETIHALVTRTDEEALRILNNTIAIMLPSINPDGLDMETDWYRRYVGTEYEAARLPWLFHKHAGRDTNRDGFQLNLPESNHLARILYRDWIPQAYIDHHQMGSGSARFSIPPYADPIRPFADPLVWREMAWYGGHMGYKLEEAGKTGVISGALFSGWGHMGFHWIAPFHNIAGMLTESASPNIATPMFMEPGLIEGDARGMPTNESQVNMPSVWDGGWWRMRDVVEQTDIAAWAALDMAARNREMVLRNAYLKAQRQIARGEDDEVRAYLIAADQHDPLTAVKMVNKLLDQGVEVLQAQSEFTQDGRHYPAGSFVVPMAQPKRGLVRWLLGQTFYPDNEHNRHRNGEPITPYDLSTDTMTEFMGVRSDPTGVPVTTALFKLDAHVMATGSVAADATVYRIDGRLNDSFRAANRLLAGGVEVQRVREARGAVLAGDFVFASADNSLVADAAASTGIDFVDAGAVQSDLLSQLKVPRIAVFARYSAPNSDEGWTRFLLEQFEFPYATIRESEIRAGDLSSRYDVIVLPSDANWAMLPRQMPTGENALARMLGMRRTPPPPEVRDTGIGDEGVDALRTFVREGGRLVSFGAASDQVVHLFELPVRNVVAGLPSSGFWSPGSTLRVNFRSDHPLAWGMPDEAYGLFLASSQAFEVLDSAGKEQVQVIGSYPDREILRSGWLLGEETIANRAAAVSVEYGAGDLVLLGFSAHHRAQTHGTFKLVFNALMP